MAELRSLALHRAVAERLAREPLLVSTALRRVDGWIAEGTVHPRYARRWREILDLPLDALLATLIDTGEEATDLRQVSPFAGVLSPRERWSVWRSVQADVK